MQVEFTQATFQLLQKILPTACLIETDELFFQQELISLLLERFNRDNTYEVLNRSFEDKLPVDFFTEGDLFTSSKNKALLISSAEQIKSKGDIAAIESLLRAVLAGSHLYIFGTSLHPSLRKAFDGRGVQFMISPMKAFQKKSWCTNWIRSILEKRGTSYDKRLPDILYASCGFDRGLLLQEIEKIYLLAQNETTISLDVVQACLTEIPQATMWQLKEAIMNGPQGEIFSLQETLSKMGVVDLQTIKYLQSVFKKSDRLDLLALLELRALELKSGERDHPVSQDLFLLQFHNAINNKP